MIDAPKATVLVLLSVLSSMLSACAVPAGTGAPATPAAPPGRAAPGALEGSVSQGLPGATQQLASRRSKRSKSRGASRTREGQDDINSLRDFGITTSKNLLSTMQRATDLEKKVGELEVRVKSGDERLQQELDRTKAELAATNERVATLTREVQELKDREQNAGGGGGGEPEEPAASLPADPGGQGIGDLTRPDPEPATREPAEQPAEQPAESTGVIET